MFLMMQVYLIVDFVAGLDYIREVEAAMVMFEIHIIKSKVSQEVNDRRLREIR